MFRNAARLTSRIAASQQKRMNSSNANQQKTGVAVAGKVVAGLALAATITLATTAPTQNAFFSTPALDIKKVKADIGAAIDAEDSKRGDGTSIGPTLVRLAWHASGTYSIFDKTGGSNGATMRFKPECEWGANAGLKGARDFMAAITKKHPQLSTADAWTLAGGSSHSLRSVISHLSLLILLLSICLTCSRGD
jgi:catalase (peroxidase I)